MSCSFLRATEIPKELRVGAIWRRGEKEEDDSRPDKTQNQIYTQRRDGYGRQMGDIPTLRSSELEGTTAKQAHTSVAPNIRHACTATTWPRGGCFLDGTRRLGRIIHMFVDDDSMFDMIPNLWREDSVVVRPADGNDAQALRRSRDETRRDGRSHVFLDDGCFRG